MRFSEYIRPWMQQRFREGLRSRPFHEPWIELSGSVDERVGALEVAIGRLGLLEGPAMLAAGRWAPVVRPPR